MLYFSLVRSMLEYACVAFTQKRLLILIKSDVCRENFRPSAAVDVLILSGIMMLVYWNAFKYSGYTHYGAPLRCFVFCEYL
jgi:hypothetical protein